MCTHEAEARPHNAMNTPTTTADDGLLALLQRPATRDEGFRRLMQCYGENLYWHIRRIVVGHEDAEDCMQETCMKAFCSLAAFRGQAEQLRPWLYQIATREALMTLRRHTHIFQSIDDLSPLLLETLHTENAPAEGKAEMLLQQALLTLSTTQRIAFNMRYFDEMTYDDIAQVTGKSVATLKTNYHYATEKIKLYISQHAS